MPEAKDRKELLFAKHLSASSGDSYLRDSESETTGAAMINDLPFLTIQAHQIHLLSPAAISQVVYLVLLLTVLTNMTLSSNTSGSNHRRAGRWRQDWLRPSESTLKAGFLVRNHN